ncbi:type I polyketide synthase [Candidatus Protochlamydia sp. W-9]|uniref:type I polyketide synthase n=1 Tax=Candidatus Protochlamydia sp. W-9 TaxID=1785087 RepID=UPI00096A9100|nr:type I polyketide synthase [Candidatus Protochlamydia sp. W-9]
MIETENNIAVIGMHGRFPKSPSLEIFWDNLKNGKELITFFSENEIDLLWEDPLRKCPNYVKAKGFLEGAEYFDASFFGYTPREAEFMDPQQRILLECAWHALEHAGYDTQQFTKRIGVFVGSSISTYLMFNILPHLMQSNWQNPYAQSIAMIGNDKDFLATRLSHKLNLRGPSKTVQTACSTSLVAIHDACQNLLDFSCDMALAGGVSITCPLKSGYLYFKEGINSPDGHCRAFDAKAQGTLIGNGAGLVVLKRLEDAIKDRDLIHAVILGSAINNDGNRKLGYTAPSIEGQTEVISEALTMSGIHPETITYIEAHGTGTIIGDPVEVKALSRAFSKYTTKKQFCSIGSIKSNIGHLDAAAGVAGLIKVILSIKHGIIPPTLHYVSPNPELNLENTPFYVNNKSQPWQNMNAPLRASISSFGIGGTNAHLILEEPPKQNKTFPLENFEYLLTISANTPEALKKIKFNLIEYLQKNETPLGSISFTLNTGRKQLPYRSFMTCSNFEDAISKLQVLLDEKASPLPSLKKPILWVFPNFEEASHYDTLKFAYPSLQQNIKICLENFKKNLEVSTFPFDQHPVIIHFAIQYSLSRLLQDLGGTPDQLLGIGIGQYVAAVIAKAMTLEDAIQCVSSWLKGNHRNDTYERVKVSPPSVPLLSPFDTSKAISSSSLLEVEYWLDQIPQVSNNLSLNLLASDYTLLSFAKEDFFGISTDSHDLSLHNETTFLHSLGALWKKGYIMQWAALYHGGNYSRVALPGYPFEKNSHWVSPPSSHFWKNESQSKEQNPPPLSVATNSLFTIIPPNILEEKLIYIWQQTLKIQSISIKDNFFEIGGDSLIALELKDLILLHFHVEIPLKAFFDKPTIQEMASEIQNLLLKNLNVLSEDQVQHILIYLGKE